MFPAESTPMGRPSKVSLDFPHSKDLDQTLLDVIAVGAHPDDVEIACGGTLARLVELGYKVGIVDLTNGEPTPGCPHVEVRLQEARAAAELLGVHHRVTLELPNRCLFDSLEARLALAKEFRRHRPRLVIGFGDRTPLASPDHWQAMQITDAAVFYSRLTKWDEYFDDLPPHRIGRQVYFRIAFEYHGAVTHMQEFVMDIGDNLEKKLKSVACYATQFPPEKAYIFDRVRAAALYAGSLAGFPAGEIFSSPTPLVTRDLMQLLQA
jgi:LmbE family N-acetylglucosaminyl deacetylase